MGQIWQPIIRLSEFFESTVRKAFRIGEGTRGLYVFLEL